MHKPDRDQIHQVALKAKKEIIKDCKEFCRFYMVEIIVILIIGTSPAAILAAVFHLGGH